MSQQAEPAGDQPQRHQHLPLLQKQDQAGGVGGKIDQLHGAAGTLQAHFAQPGVHQQQKRSRSRAVQPVVHPKGKRKQRRQHQLPASRHPRLRRACAGRLSAQHHHSHHRQRNQQQVPDILLRNQQDQPRAAVGAQDCHRHAGQRRLPIHIAVFQVSCRGSARAQGGTHLVGRDCLMGRQPRQQVGRQRDQSPSSGNRVYKARQKNQRADDQQGRKLRHGDGSFLFGLQY